MVEASGVLVVGSAADGNLPGTVTLGGMAARDQVLLLRFPALWASREIDAAFLLLEPAVDAEPTHGDVLIRVTLAAGDWTPGVTTKQPPDRPPSSVALARTRPPSVLRADVTAQLRVLHEHPESDHGLVLRADAPALSGETYLTGADGGIPRLDVYSRPRKKP